MRAMRLTVLLEKCGDLTDELFYISEVVPNDLIQLDFARYPSLSSSSLVFKLEISI